MSTTANRAFLEFWRGLDPSIAECLNSTHVKAAITEAESNGWTDWEWLTTFARRDTNGLRPGPAAAKILAQLREGASVKDPNRETGPLKIEQVRAEMNRNHQPATNPTQYADNIRKQLHNPSGTGFQPQPSDELAQGDVELHPCNSSPQNPAESHERTA